MTKLLKFLDELERRRVWYRLEHIRDCILILTATPGVPWEIEFFPDEHVEVERNFSNPDGMEGEEMLDVLLDAYQDRLVP